MAKAKVARKSTAIDMTPMVDLAFLLITFFMLTVKFRPQEAEQVIIPSSIAETPMPQKNMAVIMVGKEGNVYFGVSDQNTRIEMLRAVDESRPEVDFTEEQYERFKLLEQVPVPLKRLGQFLDLPASDREAYIKKYGGIPTDTSDNQLQTWLFQARLRNPDLRVAIKADQETPYTAVRDVINTMKKQKANRFYLITSQEADPRKTGAVPTSAGG